MSCPTHPSFSFGPFLVAHDLPQAVHKPPPHELDILLVPLLHEPPYAFPQQPSRLVLELIGDLQQQLAQIILPRSNENRRNIQVAEQHRSIAATLGRLGTLRLVQGENEDGACVDGFVPAMAFPLVAGGGNGQNGLWYSGEKEKWIENEMRCSIEYIYLVTCNKHTHILSLSLSVFSTFSRISLYSRGAM